MSRVIDYGDFMTGDSDDDDVANAFIFPTPFEQQHNAVLSFFSLSASHQALKATEYYFRRYPFQQLPVTREEHLRYICEMYFSRVYEFSERMKRCLNNLNATIDRTIDVGAMIKLFASDFSKELKARNRIHHHEQFEEMWIAKIGLLEMMARAHDGDETKNGWAKETRYAYRQASAEWAERAKKRGLRAGLYLDAIAEAFIDHATYLQRPGTAEEQSPQTIPDIGIDI